MFRLEAGFFVYVGMMIQIPMKRNQINNIGKQRKDRWCSTSLRPAQQITTSPFRFLFGQESGTSSYLDDSLAAYPDVFYFKEMFRFLQGKDWDHWLQRQHHQSSVKCLCSLLVQLILWKVWQSGCSFLFFKHHAFVCFQNAYTSEGRNSVVKPYWNFYSVQKAISNVCHWLLTSYHHYWNSLLNAMIIGNCVI